MAENTDNNNDIFDAVYEVENQILFFVMQYVHDTGRVTPYDDLDDVVNRRKSPLVECLRSKQPGWELLTLLKTAGNVLYVYDIKGYRYVALSRNYAYINPRIAIALHDVTDKPKEAIINFRADPKEESHNPHCLGKFYEHAFAKCSLAVLEILGAVYRSMPKGRYKYPFKKVAAKYKNFSTLAKATLAFCAKGSESSVLEDFLLLFNEVFQMDNALLSVDFDLLDGVIMANEIDLLWSFTGICLIRGLTSIDELVDELGRLTQRAKFRFYTEVTRSKVEDILKSRNDYCLLPGDGNVYIMNPELCCPIARLADLVNIFKGYLKKKKRLHYTKCLEVVKTRKPKLLEELFEPTFVSIASALYYTKDQFTFTNGFITVSSEHSIEYRLFAPIESPSHMAIHTIPVIGNNAMEAYGYVQEVGVRSVIVRFDKTHTMRNPSTSADVFIDTNAFCHLSATLFDDRIVEDFTLHLDIGDHIKFLYQPSNTINVHFPLYCTITHILSVNCNEFATNPQPDAIENAAKLQLETLKACIAIEGGIETAENECQPVENKRTVNGASKPDKCNDLSKLNDLFKLNNGSNGCDSKLQKPADTNGKQRHRCTECEQLGLNICVSHLDQNGRKQNVYKAFKPICKSSSNESDSIFIDSKAELIMPETSPKNGNCDQFVVPELMGVYDDCAYANAADDIEPELANLHINESDFEPEKESRLSELDSYFESVQIAKTLLKLGYNSPDFFHADLKSPEAEYNRSSVSETLKIGVGLSESLAVSVADLNTSESRCFESPVTESQDIGVNVSEASKIDDVEESELLEVSVVDSKTIASKHNGSHVSELLKSDVCESESKEKAVNECEYVAIDIEVSECLKRVNEFTSSESKLNGSSVSESKFNDSSVSEWKFNVSSVSELLERVGSVSESSDKGANHCEHVVIDIDVSESLGSIAELKTSESKLNVSSESELLKRVGESESSDLGANDCGSVAMDICDDIDVCEYSEISFRVDESGVVKTKMSDSRCQNSAEDMDIEILDNAADIISYESPNVSELKLEDDVEIHYRLSKIVISDGDSSEEETGIDDD